MPNHRATRARAAEHQGPSDLVMARGQVNRFPIHGKIQGRLEGRRNIRQAIANRGRLGGSDINPVGADLPTQPGNVRKRSLIRWRCITKHRQQ